MDLNEVKKKIIDNEKQLLLDMLADVPQNVPQEAVDAVKKKLDYLESGEAENSFEVQKVTRYSVDDFLNADIDQLAAGFQKHSKKVLKDGNSHGA